MPPTMAVISRIGERCFADGLGALGKLDAARRSAARRARLL